MIQLTRESTVEQVSDAYLELTGDLVVSCSAV